MIDQNTDITFHTLNSILTTMPGIRDHVKTASVGEHIRNSLPSTCFADTDNRLYPIHTRADAILSKSYATKTAGIADTVVRKIDNALAAWNVDRSIFSEKVEKVANTNTVNNYILDSKKAFKISSKADVPIIDSRLKQLGNKLSYSQKVEASTRLVKAASVLGESVSSDTLQMAGLTKCDLEKAAEWVDARAVVAKNKSQCSIYSKLASILRETEDTDRDSLLKVAAALESLDRLNDISKYYNKYLPSPIETIFNTKVAMSNCVYINDKEIPMDKILAMSAADIGDIVGDDIVPEIIDSDGHSIDPDKFSEIAATLPKDMKDLLVSKLGV